MAGSFTIAENLEAMVLIGGVSAFLAAALTLVWLVFMVTLPARLRDSTGDQELAFIADHDRPDRQVPAHHPGCHGLRPNLARPGCTAVG